MHSREVTAGDTAELRRQVLRAGRPVALPGDDQPAFHIGVYEVSVAHRTGGWKGRQAAFERAGCPFGGGKA